MQPAPASWGKDELSSFFDTAHENGYATYANKKPEYALLREIDSWFIEIIPNLRNRPELVPSLLIARSHSTFRAACRLSISGQCPEAFSLLRNVIECAIYALSMSKNSDLQETYLKRHEDEASLKRTKVEFSYGKSISVLKDFDLKLHKTIDMLYQRCIDHGAHPNEMAVTGSLIINESENGTEFMQKYLEGDGLQLDHVLKTAAQIGIGALYIFRIIYKERFDILGLTAKMDEVRATL